MVDLSRDDERMYSEMLSVMGLQMGGLTEAEAEDQLCMKRGVMHGLRTARPDLYRLAERHMVSESFHKTRIARLKMVEGLAHASGVAIEFLAMVGRGEMEPGEGSELRALDEPPSLSARIRCGEALLRLVSQAFKEEMSGGGGGEDGARGLPEEFRERVSGVAEMMEGVKVERIVGRDTTHVEREVTSEGEGGWRGRLAMKGN